MCYTHIFSNQVIFLPRLRVRERFTVDVTVSRLYHANDDDDDDEENRGIISESRLYLTCRASLSLSRGVAELKLKHRSVTAFCNRERTNKNRQMGNPR